MSTSNKVTLDDFLDENGDPIWSRKIATLKLMEIVKNPSVSSTDRLEAIKELNVLHGLGERDAKGKYVGYPAATELK